MKKLFILMVTVIFLSMASIAVAVDKTATFTWEQECINGCTVAVDGIDRAPVISWKIYMSTTSGVYNDPAIVEIPFDGNVAPNYTSDYVLTLSGTGILYFVVTANNPDSDTPESGYSNEVSYEYNFSATSTPVTFTFTIQGQ